MSKGKASVICPNCGHQWSRKLSPAELYLGGYSTNLSKKQTLFLLHPYCAICGLKFADISEATIDHIHPRSLKGEDRLYNYQLAHQSCNLKKGKKLVYVVKESAPTHKGT